VKQPAYKPDTWVTYQQGHAGGFGRIIGGLFDGNEWIYTVSGLMTDGAHHAVREHEISHTLQNGSWVAPTALGSNESAYKDQ